MAAVIHGRCGGHGGWIKGLYLISLKFVVLQPQSKIHHVLVTSPRVRGNEIRDEILFFAGLFGVGIKQGFEAFVGTNAGFHHVPQRPVFCVLRGYFQIATHMMRDQFLHVLGGFHGQIVAQSRGDQHFFDPRNCPGASVQRYQRGLVGIQIFTNAGKDAR